MSARAGHALTISAIRQRLLYTTLRCNYVASMGDWTLPTCFEVCDSHAVEPTYGQASSLAILVYKQQVLGSDLSQPSPFVVQL